MTIIHLTSTLGGGGAEQMVLQLSKQSNTILKTIVISLSGTFMALEKHFIHQNIEYYILGVNSFKDLSLVNGLKKFKEIERNLDDVVIHCHMFHAILFGMLYKLRYPKTKLIFTLHTNILEYKSQRLILYFSKVLRFRDIIFSQKGKKWYIKSNCEIIPNGVIFKDFNFGKRTFPSGKFKFLFIGRISHEKSPLRLIEAAKQLLALKITDFEINFVGDGILRTELSNQIKTHKLENHFKLHGFQHDIKPYLCDAHCLVLPSIREGMPVVIIEAAASRLPIVSTPVGSIPDFLNDSNAYLSEIKSFDRAMLKVIQNYTEALNKSEKLYQDIKSDFNIKSVFAKHLNLYKLSLKKNL